MSKGPNKTISYDDAVTLAKKVLAAAADTNRFADFPANAGGSLEARFLQMRGLRAILTDRSDLTKLTDLLDNSRRDADAFDALRFGVAQVLMVNEPLPWEVKVWLANYLLGRCERPLRKSGRRPKHAWDLEIWLMVQSLVERGMVATRSDHPSQESEGEKSACDAVARALSLLGLKPSSYKSVKTIWFRMNCKRDEDGNFRFEL